MMTDRELLEKLFKFFENREFIVGDKATVSDMVQRYQRPPLTLAYRVAMKIKVNEYEQLYALLGQIADHLQPEASKIIALDQSEQAVPDKWSEECNQHLKENGSFGLVGLIQGHLESRQQADIPLEQAADDR